MIGYSARLVVSFGSILSLTRSFLMVRNWTLVLYYMVIKMVLDKDPADRGQ